MITRWIFGDAFVVCCVLYANVLEKRENKKREGEIMWLWIEKSRSIFVF